MASLADSARLESNPTAAPRSRFFLYANSFMTLVMVAGFTLHVAVGRSSFAAPPVFHAHALVFFGWVALYFTQTVLISAGQVKLHRTLGLVAFAWIPLMVVMGCAITWFVIRENRAPPFFDTREFLIGNPASILLFAGLAFAAIANRRNAAWHKRLMFCAMASITGPGFGRLLPAPLLIPVAWPVFAWVLPLLLVGAGMWADRRRDGRVHPAFVRGAIAIAVVSLAAQGLALSPLGTAITRAAIADTLGADRSFAPRFPGPPRS